MGTASSKKFIKNVAGALTEEAALTTSAGAADADKIPALNASGILDDSIVNASATVSAHKLAKLNASGVLNPALLNAAATSVGAADANKVVQLDSSGRIDGTMMPVGIGADSVSLTTSEAIASGDFVNIWNSSGAKVRKADATVAGKEAHGFVLVGAGAGASVTVLFEGTNSGVTGQTPGPVFLSTTAGLAAATAPSGAGNIVQRIGFATGATAINFQSQPPVTLV